MQDQLDIVKEVISTYLKHNNEGNIQLVEWFLNSVMEEEARIQVSADRYERTDGRRAHRNGYRNTINIDEIGTEKATDKGIPI